MDIQLIRFYRPLKGKEWHFCYEDILDLQLPLSAIEEKAKQNGAYRVVRTSNILTIYKHLPDFDLKEVYSYVG